MKNKLEDLQNAFKKHKVLDMEMLRDTIHSGVATVHRYLKKIKYLTSYTHMGKYYTLPEIIQFNEKGFWHYGDIGFSKYGTLTNTILHLISESAAGQTNSDLEKSCGVRIQEMLRRLLDKKQISRLKQDGHYLYLSADTEVSIKQQERREKKGQKNKQLRTEVIIEVAIETIYSLSGTPNVDVVAKRLAKRGSSITKEEVKQAFEQLGLEKKTPG